MFRSIALIGLAAGWVATATPAGAQPSPAPSPRPAAPAAEEDELEIPAAPRPEAAPASEATARLQAQTEVRLAGLEARLAAAEAAAARAAEARATLAAEARAADAAAREREAAALRAGTPAFGLPEERDPTLTDILGRVRGPGLRLTGFAQVEYDHNQLSEDQLQQGGVPLNENQFLVRRARLRLDRRWTYAAAAVELDGNTIRGPVAGIRRGEASLLLPGADPAGLPLAALTLGLTEVPFGFEMIESNRARLFMERSLGSLAFFPGEPDVGLRLLGAVGFFRYAVGLYNGEPVTDRPGVIQRGDPNAAKDLIARVGVDTGPSLVSRVSGGVSFLHGKGFHPGRDATKNSVEWRDLNENAQIDPGELTPVPGSAATPSENFRRWALNVDLQSIVTTRLGTTRLYGELTLASNLDRGFFVADPVRAGVDIRHLATYVAFLHTVRGLGVVGFRWDRYDPNADLFDSRAGKLLPNDQSIDTFSPLLGLQLGARARLMAQYDFVRDRLARDNLGIPTDLRNDRFTLRLQVEL